MEEALKIAQIEPIVVSQTLDQAFYFSQWEYQKRTICLVKVTTESGLVGWGVVVVMSHVWPGQLTSIKR